MALVEIPTVLKRNSRIQWPDINELHGQINWLEWLHGNKANGNYEDAASLPKLMVKMRYQIAEAFKANGHSDTYPDQKIVIQLGTFAANETTPQTAVELLFDVIQKPDLKSYFYRSEKQIENDRLSEILKREFGNFSSENSRHEIPITNFASLIIESHEIDYRVKYNIKLERSSPQLKAREKLEDFREKINLIRNVQYLQLSNTSWGYLYRAVNLAIQNKRMFPLSKDSIQKLKHDNDDDIKVNSYEFYCAYVAITTDPECHKFIMDNIVDLPDYENNGFAPINLLRHLFSENQQTLNRIDSNFLQIINEFRERRKQIKLTYLLSDLLGLNDKQIHNLRSRKPFVFENIKNLLCDSQVKPLIFGKVDTPNFVGLENDFFAIVNNIATYIWSGEKHFLHNVQQKLQEFPYRSEQTWQNLLNMSARFCKTGLVENWYINSRQSYDQVLELVINNHTFEDFITALQIANEDFMKTQEMSAV